MRAAARRDASWRRFFIAHGQSCLGSGLAHVALPLLAFDKTGSPWAIAAVLIPDLLPAIVLGPVLGVVIDRVGWRTCAVAADLMRFLAFSVMAFTGSLPALFAAAALAGTGTALFAPAALTGITRLAPGESRPRALGMFGALDDIGLTAGPALAALLLAGLPPGTLLLANACTFAFSALLVAGIRTSAGSTGVAAVAPPVTSVWADVRAGLSALTGRPEVVALLASSTAAVLCIGVTNVGEVVLARRVLGLGGSGLAMLVAAGGLGTVLGSLAARGRTPDQWRRAYTVGLACMAADLLLCSLAPALPILVLVFILGGFGNGFALVHDRLLLGAAVPDALHGRVFALQKALTSFAFAGSFAGASVLIALSDVRHTFLVAGVMMLGVVACAGPRLRAAWPAVPSAGSTVSAVSGSSAGSTSGPAGAPATSA
jgi:MFS family permease